MNQLFLITVGFSLSGKTTLIDKILKKYPNRFFVIDTRSMHDYLNTQYQIFLDDNTVGSKMYKTRQRATDAMQKELLKVMVEDGFDIVKDSCNLFKEDREKQLEIIRKINPKIKYAIIYVNPSEKDLLTTIADFDNKLRIKKEPPAWLDLYEKVQKERMNIPDKAEADYFIEYNRENLNEVVDWVNKLGK